MSTDIVLCIDHFSILFAFTGDGHTQLTCVGVATAVATIVANGNSAFLALLRKLRNKLDSRVSAAFNSDQNSVDDSSDLQRIMDRYCNEMGTQAVPSDVQVVLKLFSGLPGAVVSQDIHLGNIVGALPL